MLPYATLVLRITIVVVIMLGVGYRTFAYVGVLLSWAMGPHTVCLGVKPWYLGLVDEHREPQLTIYPSTVFQQMSQQTIVRSFSHHNPFIDFVASIGAICSSGFPIN